MYSIGRCYFPRTKSEWLYYKSRFMDYWKKQIEVIYDNKSNCIKPIRIRKIRKTKPRNKNKLYKNRKL